MNRIQQLIKELCPNGVEWKTLGEIGTFVRGNGLQKADFRDEGVGCIHYGQIYTYYGLFTDKTKSFVSPDLSEKLKKVETGDIILACTSENIEDVCKCVVWEGKDTIVTGGHASIFKHNQNPRYIAYFLKSNVFEQQKIKYVYGAKVIDIKNDDLSKISIPVPPLPIQEEIVSILDKFVEQQEQLEKLIELRKKQYEYYREELLRPKEGEEWKTLGEVCDVICSGGTPNSKNSAYYGGEIPWLRTQEVDFCEIHKTEMTITQEGLANSSAKWIPANCVIVAMYGATVGKIGVNKIPLTTNQACCNLEINPNIALYKYVFYCLCNQYEYIKSLGEGSQTNINAQIVKSLSIPVPPLPIQEEIVRILDKFVEQQKQLEKLIEQSKKQYEYYREELLRF